MNSQKFQKPPQDSAQVKGESNINDVKSGKLLNIQQQQPPHHHHHHNLGLTAGASSSLPASSSPRLRHSSGIKHLFQRKKDNGNCVPAGVSVTTKADQPEDLQVSYASNIKDLPPRPPVFSRILHQIRTMPTIKKPGEIKNAKAKSSSLPTKNRVGVAGAAGTYPSNDSPDSGSRPRAGSSTFYSELDPKLAENSEDEFMQDSAGSLGLAPPSIMVTANSSEETSGVDEADGPSQGPPDPQHRTRTMIEQLQLKILKTKEDTKAEQKLRDENVNEYLKLAEQADRQQIQRIKSVFEKKNQKSNITIAQLQKKLENYHRRLKELEMYGAPPKKTKEVIHAGLKGVGANIREGVTGFSSAVVSKPKEFAHRIKTKFGSADNINDIKEENNTEEDGRRLTGSGSLVPTNSNVNIGASRFSTEEEDDASSATSGSGQALPLPHPSTNCLPQASSINTHEIDLIKKTQTDIEEEILNLKEQLERFKYQMVSEYRSRCGRVEETLNDVTELHQNEMTNLKQELASMEEKVEYQSEERQRDLQEALDRLQTRITKIEQQQQQSLTTSLEGYETASAKALLTKFINLIIAFLAIILFFLSTLGNMISPFFKTRKIALMTTLFLVSLFFMWRNRLLLEEYYQNLQGMLSVSFKDTLSIF